MPQIIEVPNYGAVEFPDETPEPEIASAIRKNVYGLTPLPEMPDYQPQTYSDRVLVSKTNLQTAAEDLAKRGTAFEEMSAAAKAGQLQVAEDDIQAGARDLKLARDRYNIAEREWGQVQKDPAPFGASLQVTAAAGALNTAAAVAESLDPYDPYGDLRGAPKQAENKETYDDLQRQLKRAEYERLSGGLSDDAKEAKVYQIKERLRALENPRAETLAGQLSGAAAQAYENANINPHAPNVAAQVGRGVGHVVPIVPTMLAGGVGLPAAVLQMSGQTYEATYTQKEQELRANGVTDEGEIKNAAEDYAAMQTVKVTPQLAAYMVGGKLASGVVGKILPEASPLMKGLAGAAAATGANVAVGGALRKFAGEDFLPNVEQLTQDALFGVIHGVGEGRQAARTKPVEAPAIAAEEVVPVETAAPVSEVSRIAPAIRVGEEVVRGNPGETHQEVLKRFTAENPEKEVDALVGFDTKENPNFFVDAAGKEISRAELKDRFGVEDSQGLRELQAAEPARNLGPGAANAEEPLGSGFPTSNKEAVVNEERELAWKDPVVKEASIGNQEAFDRAKGILEQNPNRGLEIAQRLNSQGPHERTISFEDSALLLAERARIKNARFAEIEKSLDPEATPEQRVESKQRAEELSGQLESLDTATQGARSTWGRFGQFWQRAVNEDFTFAAMESTARLKKGSELTEAETKDLQQKADRFQKAEQKLNERTEEAEAGQPVDEAIRQIEVAASKNPEFTPEVKSLAERITERLDKAAASALSRLRGKFAQLGSGPDLSIAADLAIYGSAKIAKGLVKFGQWASSMVKEFGEGVKPYLEDAWKGANKILDDQIAGTRTKKPKEVRAAVTKEKAVATADEIGTAMKTKGGKLSEMRGDIQKLVETLVRGGIKTRDPLVDAVHDVLKGVDPSITRRQTMDAISGYGDFKPLNKDQVKAEVRDIKQQLQLVAKIEDVQKRIPLAKSGIERQKLSDESRRLTSELNEALKKYGSVVTDPAKQLQTMLASTETRLTNRIKDLKAEIAAGEKRVKSKTDSPTNDKIDALRKELKTVEAEHKKLFDEPPILDAQKALDKALVERERLDQLLAGEIAPAKKVSKEALTDLENDVRAEIAAMRQLAAEVRREANPDGAQIKALEKAAAEYERRLNDADFSSKGKRQGPDTQRVAQARALRDAAKTAFDAARKLTKPVRTKEEIALQNFKAMATRKAAELEERIAKNDFAPRAKKPPLDLSKDPEAIKAKAEMDRVRNEFEQKRAEWERAQRSTVRKFWDGIKETLATSRSLITSADVSAPLRQGGFLLLGDLVFHPVRAAKQLGTMFRQLASEKGFEEAQAGLMLRPNAKLYEQFKLYLSDLSGKLTAREESMRSNMAEKIPGLGRIVRASNRAYSGFLNRQRADSFDAMVESFGGADKVTPAQAKAIADFVNTATGRGTAFGMEKSANTLARYFFSPRFLVSRFQLVTGQPFTGAARKAVAQQYGKFAVGLAAVLGLAWLNGGKIEKDPRSADFLKPRFGNTRIDLLAGLGQVTTFLARMTTGKTKQGNEVKKQKRSETFVRFGRTKLAPIPGVLADYAAEQTLDMQEPTVGGSVQRLTIPLSYQGVGGIYKEHGVLKGTILEILNLLGAGLQQYQRR